MAALEAERLKACRRDQGDLGWVWGFEKFVLFYFPVFSYPDHRFKRVNRVLSKSLTAILFPLTFLPALEFGVFILH